ncbi:hypothetical protein KY340_05375 [Candidatus Woesearchaeota archaeon]|nr:hypothetical protein [Candidatus Woesearchaeota archaeon]
MRLIDILREKGWKEEDVAHAVNTMYPGYFRGLSIRKKQHDLVYVAGLIIAFVVNVLVCIGLVPIFIVIPTAVLLPIIFIIGICFGFLFTKVIGQLWHATKAHHAAAGIVMAIVALSVMIFFLRELNLAVEATTEPIFVEHNILLISLVYVAAFLLPYIITIKNKYYSTK